MKVHMKVLWTIKTQIWWIIAIVTILMMVADVTSLSGPNVCMVKQKYNITKRVKYRAPMSVRTYEWCFAMPPRCSKWNTEMRDVTKLETEERTAEMAVCCTGYKLKDVYCVPVCPNGRTGVGCSEECPPNKWGPNCVHECKKCKGGICDTATGECRCQDGWQGESCEISMTTKAPVAMMEQSLTTAKPTSTSTKINTPTTLTVASTSMTMATTSTAVPPTTLASSLATKVPITTPSTLATTRATEVSQIPTVTSTTKSYVFFNNQTLSTVPAYKNSYELISDEETKVYTNNYSSHSEIEAPLVISKITPTLKAVETSEPATTTLSLSEATMPVTIKPRTTVATTATTITITTTTTQRPKTAVVLTTLREKETTKKIETTVKPATTVQLKAKEIWIKPAQKGESPLIESKTKSNQDVPHSKSKAREVSEATTPKTIIVSIIPTSVSYVTFKKIALTTASTMAQKSKALSKSHIKAMEKESTQPLVAQTTSIPLLTKRVQSKPDTPSTVNPMLLQTVTKSKSYTSSTKETLETTVSTTQTTPNSMSSTLNVATINKPLNSSLLTIVSSFPTNASRSSQRQYSSSPVTSTISPVTAPYKKQTFPKERTTIERTSSSKPSTTLNQRNVTMKPVAKQATEPPKVTQALDRNQADTNNKRNLTNSKSNTNVVTDDSTKDEETFHILTEPEHITAVMGDKGTERSTIDLISVISIAGGIMMAIITVAVVIVMLERCRRPRYEDVRKYNDINMQVMIDNSDIPPPYVRSIFHTPLPEPPIEKCHYQPISTLDRNLKQFMRPVVVQTISPLMLENFRGILECHYDHLPRRSQDFGPMQTCCQVAPSIDERTELLPPRVHSLTDSDIEAMKCEARMDVLDNTTSEPLYAEIPCWRPPSARAIEIVNMNGEAVTEL